MPVTAGNKADFELPGDLGEHDPRRMEHPLGNEPGSGGHEVKPNSAEVLGERNTEPTAANNDPHPHPGRDNTAEHALEGGSTETMDRAKRQNAGSHGGLREGDEEPTSRAGHQQQSTSGHHEHHGHHHDNTLGHNQGQGYDGASSTRGLGQEGNLTRDQEFSRQPNVAGGIHGHHHDNTLGHNQGQGYDGASSIRGPGQEGNFTRDQEFSRQPNVTGDIHGHHQNEGGALGRTGPGFSSTNNYQSGSEPISGQRGSGIAGEPYDAGNIQEPGVGGGAPQHSSHFGSHSTRAGELLDPSSGKETGIPGYAAGSTENTGRQY